MQVISLLFFFVSYQALETNDLMPVVSKSASSKKEFSSAKKKQSASKSVASSEDFTVLENRRDKDRKPFNQRGGAEGKRKGKPMKSTADRRNEDERTCALSENVTETRTKADAELMDVVE